MKKLVPTLIALLSLHAHGETLDCYIKDSDSSFQIVENVPSQGSATIHWYESTSVVSFTTFVDESGCFLNHHKVFFHPYYDIKVSNENGKMGTRCFTIDDGIWKGSYSAEMQAPKEVTCHIQGTAEVAP